MIRRAAAAGLLALLLATAGRPLGADTYKAAETFDAVWTIVRDSHFDPSVRSCQLGSRQRRTASKGHRGEDAGDFRKVLADMLGRLGLSHFAVIPGTPDNPSQYVDLSGQPGFDVRLLGRQLVVTTVDHESGAAAVGVKPGWIVSSINGTAVSSFLDPIADSAPPRIAQLEAWRAAIMRLRGPSSEAVNITFVGRIRRRREEGDHAPARTRRAGHRRHAADDVRGDDILAEDDASRRQGGRDRVQRLDDRRRCEFQIAMDRFRGADGIVIDLRGNPGGLAAMIMGLAGHFLPERATLGVMKTKTVGAALQCESAAGERGRRARGAVRRSARDPRRWMTGSASECFTGGMQSIGRARVFGQTSMGQALPALFDRLPNGDVLIHAWGDFVTGTGVRIEGRGVIPDESADLTRESLLAGHDAALERALAWIDRQTERILKGLATITVALETGVLLDYMHLQRASSQRSYLSGQFGGSSTWSSAGCVSVTFWTTTARASGASTNHAVVAMIEEDVKQTRCTTCDAEHVYKGGKAPRRKKSDSTGVALQGSPGGGSTSRPAGLRDRRGP